MYCGEPAVVLTAAATESVGPTIIYAGVANVRIDLPCTQVVAVVEPAFDGMLTVYVPLPLLGLVESAIGPTELMLVSKSIM
jgi:hypothetical protein